jgi:GNAT superfamily N-acetyltransferase
VRISRVRLHRLPAREARRIFDRMGEVMVATMTPGEVGERSWAARDWARRWPAMRSCDAYLAEQGGHLVGFLAHEDVRVAGRRGVHLLAAYILPEFQGRGIAFSFNARIVVPGLLTRPFANQLLILDVLNPLALRAWQVRFRDGRCFFPAVDGAADPSPQLRRMAGQVAADRYRSLDFDPVTGVLCGKTLPRGPERPLSGDPAIDDHFARHVDPAAGDTVLVVVDLNRWVVLASLGQVLSAVRRSLRRIGT